MHPQPAMIRLWPILTLINDVEFVDFFLLYITIEGRMVLLLRLLYK